MTETSIETGLTARDRQDQHLAWLIHEIRGDWDIPGIRAALHDLHDRPLAPVIQAAAIAAHTRPDQRSPWIIAQPGPHWRDMPAFEPTPQPPVYQPDTGPIATPDVAHRYADQIRETLRSTR